MNRVYLLAPLCILAGCASITPHAGFDRVQSLTASRGLPPIHWNNGTPEDREAEASIHDLLSRDLTPDRAVQIALLNNRNLQATFEQLGIAQADLVRAGLLKNPILSADAKFAVSGGTKIELGLIENFLDLLAIPLRKRVAGSEFRQAESRIAAAVIDLAFATRAEFCRYQAAARLRDLRAQSAEALSAAADLAARLRDAGNITALELATRQAAAEESGADLALAEQDLTDRRERLNSLMGLWASDTAWAASPLAPLPDAAPDIPDAEARAVRASLHLDVLRDQIDAAADRAGVARPLAAFSGASAGAVAEREFDGAWSAGPAVEIPIPIFDTGKAASAAAASELNMARNRFYAAAVETRAQVRAALAHAQSAYARARRFDQTILPLHEQIVAETLKHYNGMQLGAFSLLDARRQQLDAQARSIQATQDYWLAQGRLDALLAGSPASESSSLASTMSPSTGNN